MAYELFRFAFAGKSRQVTVQKSTLDLRVLSLICLSKSRKAFTLEHRYAAVSVTKQYKGP